MNNLEQLKKEVHAKGFNVSMMINLYKKKRVEQKATGIVPDEIYCAVCLEYLKEKEHRCTYTNVELNKLIEDTDMICVDYLSLQREEKLRLVFNMAKNYLELMND